MTTNIYFIKCNEFVKIGRGGNPKQRMTQLQTGCPYRLELMGCFEATEAEELRLQDAFAPYAHFNEWFYLSKFIGEFIAKHCRPPKSEMERFLAQTIAIRPESTASFKALFKRYYGGEAGDEVLKPAEFGKEVRAILDAWGLEYEQDGNDVIVYGAELS